MSPGEQTRSANADLETLDDLIQELSGLCVVEKRVEQLAAQARDLYESRLKLWRPYWRQIGVKSHRAKKKRPLRSQKSWRISLLAEAVMVVGVVAASIGLILGWSANPVAMLAIARSAASTYLALRVCVRSGPIVPVEPRARRCYQCRYDLSGNESPIPPELIGVDLGPRKCPECGVIWPMRPELTLSPMRTHAWDWAMNS